MEMIGRCLSLAEVCRPFHGLVVWFAGKPRVTLFAPPWALCWSPAPQAKTGFASYGYEIG